MRIDRVMYGTDFPNIPYAWDREVKQLLQLGLPERSLERVLGKNAVEFFDIKNRNPSTPCHQKALNCNGSERI